MRARQWHRADGDAPGFPPFQRGEFRHGGVYLVHRQPEIAGDGHAARGQRHAAPAPVGELHPHGERQVADRPVQRGFGKAGGGRRPGIAARPRQRDERADLRCRRPVVADQAQRGVGAAGEDQCGLGRLHPAGATIEQAHAQLPLQLGDALRDRGLRQVDEPRRRGDPAAGDDRGQRMQVADIQLLSIHEPDLAKVYEQRTLLHLPDSGASSH